MYPCASVSVSSLRVKPLNEFDHHEMNLQAEWFRIQTRFDTESKCSEMAYWMNVENAAE